jgi:D-3-phosphoglycerate dehydrogenase
MFNLLIAARSFCFASKRAMEAFSELKDLSIEKPDHLSAFNEDEMCRLLPDKDAVIVGTDKITKKVLNHANRLKFITKHGVGVDNIDIESATQAGVLVTNMPGINDQAVADMTFGLILSLSRGISQVSANIKNKDWGKILGYDVFGKTLGIIGTGNIGLEVIKRARGFNMQVLAFDVETNQKNATKFGYKYVDFEELLRVSDFISLHVPLNPGTKNLMNVQEISKMKENAYLINTSRAGIINEPALINALNDKQISGAAVDVYSSDFPGYADVYTLDNLVITPHIAAYTFETLERMDMMLVEAYKQIMNGEVPDNLNVLNPQVIET